jgi:hypothetical protein
LAEVAVFKSSKIAPVNRKWELAASLKLAKNGYGIVEIPD